MVKDYTWVEEGPVLGGTCRLQLVGVPIHHLGFYWTDCVQWGQAECCLGLNHRKTTPLLQTCVNVVVYPGLPPAERAAVVAVDQGMIAVEYTVDVGT